MERVTTALIIVVTLAFGAAVSFWVLHDEAQSKEEITGPSKVLVAAIDANDPKAAPPGARGYVKGVREHFGRIRSARFLEAYTERIGSGNTATTDVVSEIIVFGRRGAGVLKLEFDGAQLNGLWEVEPGDVHSDLSATDEAAVKAGFAKRGGKTANITVLDGTFLRDGSIR